MPINLDEIRKGRRRDWEKLQNPEERREKQREEREKILQRSKQKSWMRKRDEDRRNLSEEEEIKWQRSKKRSIILAGSFIGFLLLSSLWNFAVYRYQESARLEHRNKLQALVDSGVLYENFTSPLDTWASWRSAYLKKNSETLYNSYSKDYMKRTAGGTSPTEWKRKQTDRFKSDLEDRNLIIAQGFDEPKIRYYPKWGQRNGALCVLQETIEFPANYGGTKLDYVLVLVWDSSLSQWKVEELRNAEAWRDNWTTKSQISRTQNPEQLKREEELIRRKNEE